MSFEEEIDQFDRLPDVIVSLIFNKLPDAKSLCRSTLVCKRFASIIPEVNNVFLTLPPKTGNQSHNRIEITKSNCRSKSLLKSLIRKVITKPIQFLLHVITSRLSVSEDHDRCFHSPNEILKNFNEIQSLQIELPGHSGDVGLNDDVSLLKWRAEFGSELQSCVILGAKSKSKLNSQTSNDGEESEQQPDQDQLLANEELKMRVVWTISCLMAASSRHYLLHQIVSEHRDLRSVLVTDSSKQGRLCMSEDQIEELRKSDVDSKSEAVERTAVPALKMKLWYVPVLELPAVGCVMKGATLVVIRPVETAKKPESDGDLVARVLSGGEYEDDDDEKVFGEAVKEMMKKKKSYTLEMNSF